MEDVKLVSNNGQKRKKNKDRSKEKSLVHGYFMGHQCSIPLDEEKQNLGKVRKRILYYTTIRSGDIRARRLFRSNAALRAEIKRHADFFPFSIHPFSRLRLTVEILSIFVLAACHFTTCIYSSFAYNNVYFKIIHKLLDCLFLITMITNFFTGYVDGVTSQQVVLDLKKITWRYVRSWLVVDLLFIHELLIWDVWKTPISAIEWHDIATVSKILKLPALYTFTFNVLEIIRAGVVAKTCVEITFFIYNYLIWNIFFQFYVEYFTEGTSMPAVPRACSWMTITGIWNSTPSEKLTFALHRSVNMLRQNSNLHILSHGGCCEVFFLLSWIIAKIIVIHCVMKFMLMYFGIESARAKYYIMAQQVQVYMNQRQYPDRIKKKILKFYAVRFQSHFFVESRMMACLSGQLREDIIMHSARQLVSQVEFLKHLPRSLLLQIGTRLKLVIFLAGDIIFKIHTAGDCLYFIDKGTVSIYSGSGKEICHLEDGNFFGEIALTMKPLFRPASAVAVTNCELFRLDRKDFDSTIACYPTVYEDIKRVASQRLEKCTLMDEHHKAELRMGKDLNKED